MASLESMVTTSRQPYCLYCIQILFKPLFICWVDGTHEICELLVLKNDHVMIHQGYTQIIMKNYLDRFI